VAEVALAGASHALDRADPREVGITGSVVRRLADWAAAALRVLSTRADRPAGNASPGQPGRQLRAQIAHVSAVANTSQSA
jgi:hypothetical protein